MPDEALRQSLSDALEAHMVAREGRRFDAEFAGKRHAHLVDRLPCGLFADGNDDARFAGTQCFHIGSIGRQRDHPVRQPIFEIAADAFKGFGGFRRHIEFRWTAIIVTAKAVHGEERAHGGVDAARDDKSRCNSRSAARASDGSSSSIIDGRLVGHQCADTLRMPRGQVRGRSAHRRWRRRHRPARCPVP